jgi:hypothetical protein
MPQFRSRLSPAGAFLAAVAALAAPRHALAEQCDAQPQGGGGYLIVVGQKQFWAITDDEQKRALKESEDRRAAELKLAETQRLLDENRELVKRYQETFARQKEYVAELEVTLKGYRELVAEYRKVRLPWVTAEAGIGVTGKNTNPAVVGGLGIRALRLWGFAQKDNAGALLGLSLTIF